MSSRSLRKAARERRQVKIEKRENMVDMAVSGFGYDAIATKYRISVATVRRVIDRALTTRRPESIEAYVDLQTARLNKALMVVDLAMDHGELAAIPALTSVLREMDRYDGVAKWAETGKANAPQLQNQAPKALKALDLSTEKPDARPHPSAP